MGSTLV